MDLAVPFHIGAALTEAVFEEHAWKQSRHEEQPHPPAFVQFCKSLDIRPVVNLSNGWSCAFEVDENSMHVFTDPARFKRAHIEIRRRLADVFSRKPYDLRLVSVTWAPKHQPSILKPAVHIYSFTVIFAQPSLLFKCARGVTSVMRASVFLAGYAACIAILAGVVLLFM